MTDQSGGQEAFLTQLRRVNTERYRAWVGDGQDAGILFDAAELGGEVGELLNVVKKLEREERGWRGSRAAPQDFADECADVLICLDKLARRRGVDLEAATIAKFNATSEKVDLPHRLSRIHPAATGSVRVVPVELRALSERATPGPWAWEQCGEKEDVPVIGVAFPGDDPDCKAPYEGEFRDSDASRMTIAYDWHACDGHSPSANAAFTVAAVNYVRAALAAAPTPDAAASEDEVPAGMDERCGFGAGSAAKSPEWFAACELLAQRFDHWKMTERAKQIRLGHPGWLIEHACVEALMAAAALKAASDTDAAASEAGEVRPRCSICGGNSYAAVDVRQFDGTFAPGPERRCINCKMTFTAQAFAALTTQGGAEG